MSRHFLVKVPATSANMGPGFDCFGLALKLYNTFAFRTLDGEAGELIFNADFPLKQSPRTNLVYKAYCHTLEALGHKGLPPGIEINAFSEIPSARGLGSSASAIVAGVLAAGAIANVNIKLSEAITLATEVEKHPDNVTPAILGGMTIAIQEGRFVYPQTVPFPEEIVAIVGIPDIRVQTTSSRQILPKKVPFEDAVFNVGRASLMISSLYNKDWNGLKLSMFDKLHQQQRAELVPGLMKILHTVRNNGALGAVLSGSGPTIMIFALRSKHEMINHISTLIKQAWKKLKISSEIKVLDVQNEITRIKKISEAEFLEIVKPYYK